MNGRCWRCQCTGDISIHSHTPKGTVRYICRVCRRELYYRAKERKRHPEKTIPNDWNAAAKESYRRIMIKYG